MISINENAQLYKPKQRIVWIFDKYSCVLQKNYPAADTGTAFLHKGPAVQDKQ